MPYEYDEHDRRDYDTNICPRCGRWIPVNDEDEACQPFHPSTDWNDAMLAAEKCFGSLVRNVPASQWNMNAKNERQFQVNMSLAEDQTPWWTAGLYVWNDDDYYHHYWQAENVMVQRGGGGRAHKYVQVEGVGATGPEAICQAIMEYAKRLPGTSVIG